MVAVIHDLRWIVTEDNPCISTDMQERKPDFERDMLDGSRLKRITQHNFFVVTKNKVIPLFCSPSPRDIPDVKRAMWTIPYDKLWAKYYLELSAYRLLQGYFLDHKQYNYMVIVPDDLIINKEGVDLLVKDLEEYEYPVLSGVCNWSWQRKDRYTCGPTINGGPTTHTEETLQEEVRKQGSPIIKVGMEGFSCMFIHRRVLERFPEAIKGMPFSSLDWGFCHSCYHNKIPVRVDTRAKFVHLASRAKEGMDVDIGMRECFFRGRKIPKMVFEPGDGSMIATIREESHVAVLPL